SGGRVSMEKKSYSTGEAVVYRNGALETGDFTRSLFLNPGSIGLKRWQDYQSVMRNDHGLIGYFPFLEIQPGVVHNFAQFDRQPEFSVLPDGKIFSATWVEGRWPGKRALMFETAFDHVALEIPGQHQELTFAAWLKLDRINNSHNVILNSNGWGPGAIHWQVDRMGGPWLATFGHAKTNISKCVPVGRWVHVASTISTKTGIGKTYLNGNLASEYELTETDGVIEPGLCRIGNWLNPKNPRNTRAFSGRIDELMIWKRSIGEDEIIAMVESGKPSAAWQKVW
ncbi:MAG: LamG domain-containing protein, partial [Planctomycetota bacterium]